MKKFFEVVFTGALNEAPVRGCSPDMGVAVDLAHTHWRMRMCRRGSKTPRRWSALLLHGPDEVVQEFPERSFRSFEEVKRTLGKEVRA